MKIFNAFLLFLLVCTSLQAQKFFATTFDKLPQNYQLYPRNDQNEAFIPISGKIEEEGWEYFSVQILRNKQVIGYQKARIIYTNAVGKFAFSPIKIKAEKAEYGVKIYALKGKDSLNVANRENIVSGDVYLVSGQSNATVFFNDSRKNEFCRTFGKISGTWGVEVGNPADTLWALSNQDTYNQGVGTMGFEFQQTILEKYGIPTCVINGGFNWSSMKQHATRTAINPVDLTNGYGRMLYRIQKAGVDLSVKALIFRQGETEAYGEGADWGGNFDVYYRNLKTDLPSLKQIYLFQIDIIDFARPDAPQVRDIQRKVADKYPDIQVVASVGTAGFDGLHYTSDGYIQNAQEFTRLIGRDFYNSTDVDNINAPNIRRAFFSNREKTEINLLFDGGQELVWTDQVRNLLMKNQYYLNGINGVVSSGSAVANQVILKLNSPTTATLVSYLPPAIDSKSPDFPYTGPYIKNKRGLRALSFFEVKIEPYVPVPTVSFTKIPQNLQLFPRNLKNEAVIDIKGKIETTDYNTLSLVVFRNNALVKYYKNALSFMGKTSNFSFSHTIKAELANYNFKIYAIKGADSVLVTSRENVVAGDAYLINGQSNAAAWGVSNTFPNSDYRNDFCRTFGQVKLANPFITESDTTWALSNNGKPYVGVWGIELQKQLVEKYGIPVCFMNEAISGSAITEHTNRDATNPSNVANVYGRLLYRAKKSGHFDNLKGFFYWQGEAEAIDKPAVWKPEFEKLYNFWKIDYPSVGKFYIFQINITGFPFAEAADLRDYQRRIKQIFPKTETIATIGNAGYDGGHYTIDGYKKMATDVFKLVARDFYGSSDSLQINSPNVQKAFYSTMAKDEITILFDDSQKMVWLADSTYNQDNGTLRKYFMKDFIYLNNATDKVLTGRAEINKIILKTTGFTGNQTLTYLPAYYPLNYPADLRGIFGGPFLKNQRGMSAFSFNKQMIAEPLNLPTLSAKIQTATSVQLSWKEVINAAYILEMKDSQSENYKLIKNIPKATLSFLVDNLAGNTAYTFRIRAILDQVESENSTVQIQTPKALDLPILTASPTGIESIKLSWKTVPEAINYIIERKNLTTNSFEQITKVEANVLEYQDKLLKNSTLYSYRIKAIGVFTESTYVNVDAATLVPLQSPELALTVLYYNSIKLNWKTVPNANSFILERKSTTQAYKIIATFESTVVTFTDKDLLPNSLYSYRIKAIGGQTESLLNEASMTTPNMLTVPELSINSFTHEALTISWKPVQKATEYILERKNTDFEEYKVLIKFDGSKTEYADFPLQEKTTYFYRLKAYGDKTESDFATLKGTTATILANEKEVFGLFELFPNPSNRYITIKYFKPMNGQIMILDLRGVEIFQQEVTKTTETIIQLNNYQSGNYVLIFKNEEGSFSKKLVIF